ncbi:hypothetical protein VTK73DRAFT_1328 [Phialemonium thermophilum]|uniref:GPI ethanolamine phosphate transferase 2 n=1 Tax=Phialemonium thermophilum TaxID=223376 RepID=A0ABR3X9Y7_9PEZI
MAKCQDVRALTSVLLLCAANLLIPVAIVVFATGFFPYKPFLPGLAQYSDFPEHGDPPPAPFDRLVFMVVDALRSDFVYAPHSGFEYTQSLIRRGAAVPFTAHATSPTVTMPRLKAITTGSIPSFLDVILNLDEGDESSTLASQDSWLAQMKAKRAGKLVMYGDDTWLKLFPDTFDRADGTTSFFVSDFTEVDNNVTRHIAEELRTPDWNVMVLHYLGLDHIGHKGGPRSSNMIPKQREMDAIVERIFHAIETEAHLQSTLFVLCGDHGMNDAGNHGGSSPGETSPALMFISPKFEDFQGKSESPLPPNDEFQYYSSVEQSDIAPTLAALLGFPVPKNNLGAFIVDFLPLWTKNKDKVHILMRNARQILNIVTAAFGSHLFEADHGVASCAEAGTDIEELACMWNPVTQEVSHVETADKFDQEWVFKISTWLRKAQRLMSSMASNYDLRRLVIGQAVATLAVVASIVATGRLLSGNASSLWPIVTISFAYGVMMFGSSYVEEEQHFWYWLTSAWLAYLGLKGSDGLNKKKVFPLLLALVATRVIRGWNQTGQKFAGEPDIVKTFINTNPVLLWSFIVSAYLWVYLELSFGFRDLPDVIRVSGITALVLAAATFKLAFTNEDAPELVVGFLKSALHFREASLVARARAVFIGLAVAVAWQLYVRSWKPLAQRSPRYFETLRYLYIVLAMTQSRATNIPLFLLFNIQLSFLGSLDLSVPEMSTSILLLSYASFFALGGSNAISSVDLSSAYNGVSDFNIVGVGILTFVSNWAAPIFWTFAAISLLLRRLQKKEQNDVGITWGVFVQHIAVQTLFTTVSVAAVMAACTTLRTHLFIWTVFSPKYLYCVAWSLGQHLVVQVGLGVILFWLGQ